MKRLEEYMPELADVLVSQESSMQRVVETLTSQVRQLLKANARKTAEVIKLEARHMELTEEIVQLRSMNAEIERRMPNEAQVISQVQDMISGYVGGYVESIEAKMEQNMLEMSNRAYLHAKQAEESMKVQVDSLEKKFEYISRVKMEIKDINKRIDKQDQTIDGMKIGMEMLAKSIGADESDGGEDNEDKEEDEEAHMERQRQAMMMMPTFNIGPSMNSPPPSAPQSPTRNARVPLARVQSISAISSATEQPRRALVDNVSTAPLSARASDGEDNPEAGEAMRAEFERRRASAMITPLPPQPLKEEEPAPSEEGQQSAGEPPLQQPPNPEPTDSTTVLAAVETPPPVIESPPRDPQPIEQPPEPPQPEVPPPVAKAVVDTAPVSRVSRVRPEQEPAHRLPRIQSGVVEFDDESDEGDDVVAEMSSPNRPGPGSMLHMPSAPNLSTLYTSHSIVRSRRQVRSSKRQSVKKEETHSAATRKPLTKEAIKALWVGVLRRLVQLKRLQGLNGEQKLFKNKNMSMGARVKRLEETAHDMEDTMELLEMGMNSTAQSVAALDQAVTQKLEQLNESNAELMTGQDERIEVLESELRRLRTSSRRDSLRDMTTQSLATIAAQIQEINDRLVWHKEHIEASEQTISRVVDLDLPRVVLKIDESINDFRTEVECKTRDLSKDLTNSIDHLKKLQEASQEYVLWKTTLSFERIYRDLMSVTSSLYYSVELLKGHNGTQAKSKKTKSALDVSIDLLAAIFSSFQNDIKPFHDQDASSAFGILYEKSGQFQQDLLNFREAATAAARAATNGGLGDGYYSVSGFEEQLTFAAIAQLRNFESVLNSKELQENNVMTVRSEIIFHTFDIVIQLRAVIFFLFLRAALIEPHAPIKELQVEQGEMRQQLTTHAFAISQIDSMGAVVKLVNSRVDTFMELTQSFAKDADVKKLFQELLNSADLTRENLAKQLENLTADSSQRDEVMEKEIGQLMSRVNKKLDKEELLWTQEVLERQMQSVAKASLGEEDLKDIHRILRTKLDKRQFHELMQQQRTKLLELAGAVPAGNANGGGGGAGAGGGGLSPVGGGGGVSFGGSGGVASVNGNPTGFGERNNGWGGLLSGNADNASAGQPEGAPLIGAKCISCNGDVPPTKAMMKELVRIEVQQELSKALAKYQQQQGQQHPQNAPIVPAVATFNASSYKSMEKHKMELLLSSLQKQNKR